VCYSNNTSICHTVSDDCEVWKNVNSNKTVSVVP